MPKMKKVVRFSGKNTVHHLEEEEVDADADAAMPGPSSQLVPESSSSSSSSAEPQKGRFRRSLSCWSRSSNRSRIFPIQGPRLGGSRVVAMASATIYCGMQIPIILQHTYHAKTYLSRQTITIMPRRLSAGTPITHAYPTTLPKLVEEAIYTAHFP